MEDEQMELHYRTIINAVKDNRIIPFLGAGANLCDRPEQTGFQRGTYLPSGAELAEYLANTLGGAPGTDLARVSQYIALIGGGTAPLYEELHNLLNTDYPPTLIHKLLAVMPAVLRNEVSAPLHQLIVTTNYDDMLERCFFAMLEPFDVVSYVADGEHRGKFMHWAYGYSPALKSPEGQGEVFHRKWPDEDDAYWQHWPPIVEPNVVHVPNDYAALSLDRRPVILKIHGAIDRSDQQLDSYVIMEDDYIDYLTRTEVSEFVPVTLAAKLRTSNFWFLGYSLRDWNLRVILRRIWREHRRKYNSWAVQLRPEYLDEVFWSNNNVRILNKHLHDYTCELTLRLKAGPYITRLDERLKQLQGRAAAAGRGQRDE